MEILKRTEGYPPYSGVEWVDLAFASDETAAASEVFRHQREALAEDSRTPPQELADVEEKLEADRPVTVPVKKTNIAEVNTWFSDFCWGIDTAADAAAVAVQGWIGANDINVSPSPESTRRQAQVYEQIPTAAHLAFELAFFVEYPGWLSQGQALRENNAL